MKRYFILPCLLLSLLTILSGCAKRGTPEGGPLDVEPPEYVRARPENFSTNFDAEQIRIFFDEYVKLTDPQRQIIISPPMDPRPEITPLGTASKSIKINITDTLQENTTYTINFGRSITDNNEGNPLDYFTYAFSTGPYIDSLSVSGSISDALLKVPEPFISVMLYEVDSSYTDSVIFNEMPRYVTNTLDSATTYQFENLKEGTYRLVAMKDNNNNYLFEPDTDKVAFLDKYVTIPTESVFDLILFKEELSFRLLRPDQSSGQHIIFGYEGRLQNDNLEISLLGHRPPEFVSRITKDREKDTLHYWYKPELERDSLLFELSSSSYRDTLVTRVTEMKRDSLQFEFEPASNLMFEKDLLLLPSVPLTAVNDSLIRIVNQDTLPVPFTSKYDSLSNSLAISFEKEESQQYRLTAFPGAFTGFFGAQNDTLQEQFSTRAYSDFGNLIVNLENVREYPVIVQLTTEKGEVRAEKFLAEQEQVKFSNLTPGKYFLRLVHDKNGNRRWDTGNFLNNQQPEEVIYYPEIIDVRANWDVTQTFNAG